MQQYCATMALPSPALAVLAHPLRSRLVTALRQGGPSTATALARELGTNSGATSYHLRRLATVGLVEDADSGKGRERVWRTASRREPQDGDGDGADAVEALRWLEHDYVQHAAEQTDRWLDASSSWPRSWQREAGTRDAMVLVTADQLAALRAELAAVLAGYRRVGQGNPDAKRVVVYTTAFPVDIARPPTPPS
jgi:predicted ArsR family transcriptional regulator